MGKGVRQFKIVDRRERRQILLSKNSEAETLFNRLEKNLNNYTTINVQGILEELFAEEINPSNILIWLDRIRSNQTTLEELKYDRFNFPEMGFNEFS